MFDTVSQYLTHGQNIWHSGIIFNTVPQYFNSRKFHTGTQYVTQWHNILHRDTIIDTVHCCGIIFDTGTKSLTHWHNGLGHQLGNFSTTLGTMPKYVNYGQICQICILGCDTVGVRQSRWTRLVTGLLKAWPPNPVCQLWAENINYHTNALPFQSQIVIVPMKER